ncbi:HTH-type transcriptional regulator [Corynebacterium humireducens NBRC 106098 = DSM 45392]|uniref:HTH-type transcriptional regulator n=1 Tax=Corynebacterium humireducens NBRC 106098 = DSM 45392 TaxID=1223515 RepID=A0A0B5DCJ5_9CORY|nr:MerR family transcriptional regulator [Corynebacterium humireducens]AJE33858.1 HTH-type transcriptional regulator [Corynebacterium humireducens NBRC 106098 = DSM 45392]
MRISEVARAAGCSVRAVRHYHASGALPEPPRTAGGYRDYGLGDLAALLRVRALVDAGITLADIRSGSPTLIDAALSRIDSQLAALRAQRSRLLALQAGERGLPADLRSGIRDLLGDHDYTRMEIDALDLMGLSGVATAETWEVLRRNLADPARRAEALRLRDLWEELGETAPTGAAADELIAELRPLTGLVHGVVDTLTPGDVPLGVRDVATRGAQARALAELTGAL